MKRISDQPKRKKPGFGKQKGGEYERVTCKQLSLWVTDGARDDIFWRSAMSGGRASVQFKKGKTNQTQSGDISAIDPLGAWIVENFILEIKSYKDLDVASGILNQKGLLYNFWVELKNKAAKINKKPILVAKQNRVKAIVVISFEGETTLHLNAQKALAILPYWSARLYSLDYILGTKYAGKTVT